jgi:DNA-binding NarL/FixJ family response regulator
VTSTTAAPLRVLTADDDAELRAAYRLLLGSDPGIEVVGEAADGAQAVTLARELSPDVILMDVRMPGVDGIAATRAVVAADPRARVLVLTMFDLDEYVWAALRAGASGFLLKNVPPSTLLAAVRTVAAGEALLAPTVTRRLIDTFVVPGGAPAGGAPSTPEPLGLTPRERDTLELVARGLSNQEIADDLVLSHATVRTYISRLLDKLAARDRAQLVIAAYESGLVSPQRR